jgi:nucleoside-diphosphate-sugar epimerase
MMYSLSGDLDFILDNTRDLWEKMRGERIFISGGTGFFGHWMLESIAWANARLHLNTSVMVLSRNPDAFKSKFPHLANDVSIKWLVGDNCSFSFPDGDYSFIAHMATEPLLTQNDIGFIHQFDANIQGTRRLLEFSDRCNAKRFLFTSSGAVYGKQPYNIMHVSEEYPGAPDTMNVGSAYGQSKRISEYLCSAYSHEYGLEVLIARCFAFVGPYLPLNSNYAIGNFIADAISGKNIQILGDGTPYRSYLYAADLAIWLWTILFSGESCRPYNVGSDQEITIADLAGTVRDLVSSNVEINIAKTPLPDHQPERYVPSIERAKKELNLQVNIPLKEAILRTSDFYTGHI